MAFRAAPEPPRRPGPPTDLLSWVLPRSPRDPSVRVASPLHRRFHRVHTLWDPSIPQRGPACRPSPCSALVVLHHLSGFLRDEPAGLLRPAASPGVAGLRLRRPSREVRRRFPTCLAVPSEDSPLTEPCCVTAAPAPSPLVGIYPSRSPMPRFQCVGPCERLQLPSASRPCSRSESVALDVSFPATFALSSRGFLALRGLHRDVATMSRRNASSANAELLRSAHPVTCVSGEIHICQMRVASRRTRRCRRPKATPLGRLVSRFPTPSPRSFHSPRGRGKMAGRAATRTFEVPGSRRGLTCR